MMNLNEIEFTTLGKVTEIKGGKRLPAGVTLLKQRNKHPYIRVRDLNDVNILEETKDFEYVDPETQKKISRYIVSEGDIVLSIVGTIGLLAIVGKSLHHANLTENCVKITNIDKNFDKTFIFYYLRSNYGQSEIKKGTVGAVQAKLPLKNIATISVPTLPLTTQQQIARILSSIDDKIELNAQINHNLEEQAKAIFKSWFVDFEPFGNCSPDNWKSGLLGDFVEIKRGGSPRPIQNYLSDRGLRWLKISDATACSSPFIIDIKEHIEESGLSKTVLLHAGALVLSNSATPGIPKILDVDSCIHDGWLYFPKSRLSNEFLFLFFKHIRPNLVSLGNGSVFTNLKTDILKAYPFILPDEEILNSFNDIVVPMFEKIKNNSREINGLAQLRDALLPKLMSGEIDVSEVEV